MAAGLAGLSVRATACIVAPVVHTSSTIVTRWPATALGGIRRKAALGVASRWAAGGRRGLGAGWGGGPEGGVEAGLRAGVEDAPDGAADGLAGKLGEVAGEHLGLVVAARDLALPVERDGDQHVGLVEDGSSAVGGGESGGEGFAHAPAAVIF